jgi:hypothetical protein
MTKVFNVETLSQRKRQTLASYCWGHVPGKVKGKYWPLS